MKARSHPVDEDCDHKKPILQNNLAYLSHLYFSISVIGNNRVSSISCFTALLTTQLLFKPQASTVLAS